MRGGEKGGLGCPCLEKMVCGGFGCSRNALCALNVVYMVSVTGGSLASSHEWGRGGESRQAGGVKMRVRSGKQGVGGRES